MQHIQQQIDELREALQKALAGHELLKAALKQEQDRLQQALVEKQTLQNEVKTLREQVKTIKLAQAIHGSDDQSNHELKIQINRYLREIDKCLQLINSD
ncbi:MAG: hypothetical protein U0Y08_01525 [Bacteroidia bacterium]